MIINIRGTSGSGKSTVVRKIMKYFGSVPVLNDKGRIEAYKLPTAGIGDIYVIGKYETPCGGCDGIATQDEVRARVKKYAKKGHVIFEGLLVTSCYDKYRIMLNRLKQPYHFIFLKTSLDTCIKSVIKRREKRGNDKPFNPINTEQKYKANLRVIERCKEDNVSHSVISRNNAVEEILCLLKQHPFKTMK